MPSEAEDKVIKGDVEGILDHQDMSIPEDEIEKKNKSKPTKYCNFVNHALKKIFFVFRSSSNIQNKTACRKTSNLNFSYHRNIFKMQENNIQKILMAKRKVRVKKDIKNPLDPSSI